MTRRTVADYLALVPPEHATDANFMAELAMVLQPFADAQAFIASLPDLFDVDRAIGVQLDAVGAWAGTRRNVPIPVENPWFRLDVAGYGADQGYWFEPFTPTALATLDDETFRRLIRAVIVANSCDGLLPSIQKALSTYFGPIVAPTLPVAPGLGDDFALGDSEIGESDYSGQTYTNVWVVDGTDYQSTTLWFTFDDPARGADVGEWFDPARAASAIDNTPLAMQIGVTGALPSKVDLAILAQGLIPIKPAGVAIEWGVTTVDGYPVFGFDVDNGFIGGLDKAAIGADPDWVAANILPQ